MWLASGSTMGIARSTSVRPSVAASRERHHAGPASGADMGIQHDHRFDSRLGRGSPPGVAQQAVDDAAQSACRVSSGTAGFARPPPISPCSRLPSGASAAVSRRYRSR